tara:strand:- start:1742 stop:2692 length:951 start_codon:yes stop_codon:yes gene_type:complete
MKKSIIAYFIVAAFLVSCSDSVSTNETNPLAGIWQQIGRISIKDGKFNDTVFYSVENLARPKIKFIGKGMGDKINSSWFRSDRRKDSTRSTTSYDGEFYYNEWYVASKVEIKNDSFFSYPVYYHDYGRTNQRRKRLFENGYVHKRKVLVDGDNYTQYSVNTDGTGLGELWKRLDNVGKNPTKLTGIFERSFRVIYNADGSIRDSVSSGSTDESHNIFMFGDKMMARVANAKYLDDKGVDQQQGQALLVNYKIDNDNLVENIIFGTRRFQDPDNLPASWTGPRRSQSFEIDQEYFKLTQIHTSGDGRKNVQYFKKIE